MKLDFSDEKTVGALVERRHPEFKCNEAHWKFCDSCYVGGRKWLEKDSGNVFRFYKEGQKEYEDRLARTYRANHTKRVIETVGQYLFKQRPTRDASAPDLIDRFWKNVDRNKRHMTEFMAYADRMESVFGQIYIVVDRPAQIASSRSEERLPYSYVIKPTHFLDAGYDEDGVMEWCTIAEDYRDDAKPTDSGKCLMRIRLWTRDEWYLFTPVSADEPDKFEWTGKDGSYGVHDLGQVPVIPHRSTEGSAYSAPALIADIAYMDRTIVNYGSLLDEILYEQTYSQLTLPAESILPGTTEMGQMIAAAKNRVFLYAGGVGSTGKPEYISPDASQANLIRDAISDLMRTIYAVTGTDNDANSQSMSTGKSYASGTVRQFDHAAIENMLLGKAQNCERTEDRIMELVFAWMGEDADVDPKWVRYPTSFDIRGLQADLAIGLDLAEMAAPEIIVREHMKSMTEKLFPRKDPDEIQQIYDAIDAWTPQYKVDAQLAERQVAVSEDGNEVSREQIEATTEGQKLQIEAQKETAKAQAKAAAAKPKPKAK